MTHFSFSFSLVDPNGKELSSGECEADLEEDSLSIQPESGDALFISLRDILEISAGDYKINLLLSSNEKLNLLKLGHSYEDFLRILNEQRNNLILKDMLVTEKLAKKSDVEANYTYTDENNQKKQEGKCTLRLYETSLVVMPEKAELMRIPISDISGFSKKDYSLVVNTELGEKLVFSMMGAQLDPFTKALSDADNKLQLKVQSLLKEILPEMDPATIKKVSKFMKEGRLAKRSDIESVSPVLWTALEKRLGTIGIKEEYDFLKSLSQQEKICMGIKRGLMGEMTGDYFWFFVPIYSTDPKKPGNAVAMEASSGTTTSGEEASSEDTSGEEPPSVDNPGGGASGEEASSEDTSEEGATGEGVGRATYFFRIVSRDDYPQYKNVEDLHKEFDELTKKISRCMIDINFRREPIYLPDERLDEPKYLKYKFAVLRSPSLRILRTRFIGRVIHSSPEQWKKDVTDLLKFNVSAKDDSVRWKKEANEGEEK
ncbi:MAG: hypothetical protein WED07_13665 [Candidatus Freyarchaeum deiterrae]